MARSVGSMSSKEAKLISDELVTLSGTSYKQNFDYLRFIEMLLCYRISESVRKNGLSPKGLKPDVTIEIPLIGNLTIKPTVFHRTHRLTNEQSIHFEYEFKPTSCFKTDISKAYETGESDIPIIFTQLYGEKLKDYYNELKEGNLKWFRRYNLHKVAEV